LRNKLDIASTPAKIRAMITLGVPYPDGYDKTANDDLTKQAASIVANIKSENNKINVTPDKEIIALIAYLQRLGRDIQAEPKKQPIAENK
jgi:cytochrome c oxidase cbb3-type subunit I/II